MSSVDRICKEYEEKGFGVITIHTGRTKKVAENFVSMLKIQFPVSLDPDSKAATQCGVSGLPSTLILDRDGTIKAKILGEAEGDAQRKAYEKLISALL